MPKTARKKHLKRKIHISKENYERILMWSQSRKEILFYCLGNGNSVEKVVRTVNVSRKPQNSAVCSENAYKSLIEPYKETLEIICEGHSHPSKHHDRYPSRVDIESSMPGDIELIAFPHEKMLRGWIMSSTLEKTKKNEIEIKIEQI